MKEIGFLNDRQWHPFSYFGFKHPFFSIDKDTIINTWVVLLAILVLIILARMCMRYKSSIGRYISLGYVRSFTDLCSQSFGYFAYNHTAFIIALFTFIILCNCIAVIPGIEEPTKELNTTLALGILSFIYIQVYAIKAHGFWGYIKEYFTPFFFMFPLHVIGKLSTVVSISFRLFGNIFGGATIIHLYNMVLQSSWLIELGGLLTGLNIIMVGFFIIFEGFLQAFVFTMLAMTYLAIAIAHEEDHDQIGEMT
jgi:F-type H+-transporting ATPase subunit a